MGKPYVKRLADKEGVYFVTPDMCKFGLRIPGTKGPHGESGLLSKKPTGILTNVLEIAQQLDVRCDKSHEHGLLVNGTAAEAA